MQIVKHNGTMQNRDDLISHKELCYYWLKLVERIDLISSKELQPLLTEANELIKIVAKSVITVKGGGR